MASTPLKPVSYSGNRPIYPAVVKMFSERNAKITKIDIFNEEFSSDYIYAKDLILDIRFKLLIKNNSGLIDIAIIEMQEKNPKNYVTWIENKVTIVFDKNKYINTISNEIIQILNNTNEYDNAKDKILSNLSFNHLVLKDLTDVGRERWIDANMKGRIYNLHLALNNFEKNNNTKINKKYVARFSWFTKGFFPEFFIHLYTDRDDYATLKKGTKVETKGSLLSARDIPFDLDDSFIVSLMEEN